MKDKELERRVTEILLGILTALIILMALVPVQAFAVTTVKLQYGQCITVRSTKYCAPAKNICPTCPTQKPCPTQSPCNCPVPTPCPEQVCPAPLPCPTYIPVQIDANAMYWYASSALMVACGTKQATPLLAEPYIPKFIDLDLGDPVSEKTQSGCLVREWTKALAIVNPMDSFSCTIPFSGTYKDLNTGTTVNTSATVGPKRGKVLVK